MISDQNDNSDTSKKNPITVIHCWSSPHLQSTNLLYFFKARGNDCVAFQDDLHDHHHSCNHLDKNNESIVHFFDEPADEKDTWMMEKRPSLSQRLCNAIEELQSHKEVEKKGGVVFISHMVQHCHLYDFDAETEIIDANRGEVPIYSSMTTVHLNRVIHKHVLHLQDPIVAHGGIFSLDEIGINILRSIYMSVTHRQDKSMCNKVVIVDADELTKNPAESLKNMCEDLEIEYRDCMLSCKKGFESHSHDWLVLWDFVCHSLFWSILFVIIFLILRSYNTSNMLTIK